MDSYEEYNKLLEELMTDETFAKQFLITASVLLVICSFICYLIAAKNGLSKFYAFLGLLGVDGICMVICRKIAKDMNASPFFLLFGLFHIYGVLIMLVLRYMSKSGYMGDHSGNMGNHSGNMGNHSENKGEWSDHMNRWENNGRFYEEQKSEGYNLNGVYYEREDQNENEKGAICLNCGAAVAGGVKICPHCGQPL